MTEEQRLWLAVLEQAIVDLATADSCKVYERPQLRYFTAFGSHRATTSRARFSGSAIILTLMPHAFAVEHLRSLALMETQRNRVTFFH
jgi:hypothetical protein